MSFAKRYFVTGSHVRVERIEHLARLIGCALPRDGQTLLGMFWQDDELLLDAIDHALQYPWKGRSHLDHYDPRNAAFELKAHLADARSVYYMFPVENPEHDSPVKGDERELDIQAMRAQPMMSLPRVGAHQLGYRQPPEINKLVEYATSDRS